MKKLILLALLTLNCNAFDFSLGWDWNSDWVGTNTFTTNESIFVNLKGFNLYRGTTVTNFVLYQYIDLTNNVTSGITNIVTLTNQPSDSAYFFVKVVKPDGTESMASNTNHVFPPIPPSQVDRLTGHK